MTAEEFKNWLDSEVDILEKAIHLSEHGMSALLTLKGVKAMYSTVAILPPPQSTN